MKNAKGPGTIVELMGGVGGVDSRKKRRSWVRKGAFSQLPRG
jgi:hypothetical protein